MTLGKRIKDLRIKAGLTQEQLAIKIGYSTKTSISKIENDVLDINQSTIVALARALNTTPSIIMGWEEKEAIKPLDITSLEGLRIVPLYESVSAGFGTTAQDYIIDYVPTVIRNDDIAARSIAIKVSGDSMYPKIEDGDIIIVQKQDTVDNGQIAVVLIDSEDALVKKIRISKDGVELISINPEYKPRKFEKEEMNRLKILGLVKQVIKTL